MIDVEKIQVGDKLKLGCPILIADNGDSDMVRVVEEVEGIRWISGGKVELANIADFPEDFTLVATNTKYSDIDEGDIVEIACLSDEQIDKWDCEHLIGQQGEVIHKSKSIHVEVDGLEWCLQPENLRVVEKAKLVVGDKQLVLPPEYLDPNASEDRKEVCEVYKGIINKLQQDAELKIGVFMPESNSALDKQVSGSHYKDCGIQPIEYIHANGLDYFQGNVVKYVTRHKSKNGKADIEKAIHYLELILELQYKDE